MKIEYFKLSIVGIVKRFFLLMAVVIVSGFSGQWWLSILALPILLSAMTGATIKSNNGNVTTMKKRQEIPNQLKKAA